MPRKSNNNGKPRAVRQSGYQVTIKGFVPFDKSSLESQKAAIDLLTEAMAGDVIELVKLLNDIEFSHKFTSRPIPAATGGDV